MSQAIYSPDNRGHFGLAFDAYAHFTSPIRRYPDLLVHRGIKQMLQHKKPSTDEAALVRAGEHCSMTERRADDATNEVNDWLKCEFMMDKVGQEFAGVISGAMSFGVFVELADIYVEGLVHISTLPDDYYQFDPVKHVLLGERSGKRYTMGDPIKIRVARWIWISAKSILSAEGARERALRRRRRKGMIMPRLKIAVRKRSQSGKRKANKIPVTVYASNKQYVFGLHAGKPCIRQPGVGSLCVLQDRKDKKLEALLDLAKSLGIPVDPASRQELDRMSDEANHQGVIAFCNKMRTYADGDLKQLLSNIDVPFLLILDGVQDPHNLGACFRSADAAGVHAIIAPKDKAVGITPVVSKVACGAAETMPFFQVTNLARTMEQLKEAGVWLYGADADATQTLYEAKLSGPLGMVLGAEGSGMRRLTRELYVY